MEYLKSLIFFKIKSGSYIIFNSSSKSCDNILKDLWLDNWIDCNNVLLIFLFTRIKSFGIDDKDVASFIIVIFLINLKGIYS